MLSSVSMALNSNSDSAQRFQYDVPSLQKASTSMLTLRKESDTFTFFTEIGAVEDADVDACTQPRIQLQMHLHPLTITISSKGKESQTYVLRLRRTRRNSLHCEQSRELHRINEDLNRI